MPNIDGGDERTDRLAYSPEEAAGQIGYSKNGLQPYLNSGELRSFKLGKKRRLILRSDLIAFLYALADQCAAVSAAANLPKSDEQQADNDASADKSSCPTDQSSR